MERPEFVEFQTRMKSAVLSGTPDNQLVQELEQSSGVPPEQRLNIHHNNYRETLAGSLSAVFPALEAFVGTVFLKGALGEFCLSNPPKEAALSGYGAEFGEFLASHRASEQVPYAADLARLEWAVHELQLLDETATQQSGRTTEWRLSDTVRLIPSDFPLLSLWSVANGQLPPEAVHLDQGGQTVAVLLAQGEVSLLALEAEEAALVADWQEKNARFEAPADSSSEFQALIEKNIIVPA